MTERAKQCVSEFRLFPQAFVELNPAEFVRIQTRPERLAIHQRLVAEDAGGLALVRLL